MKQFSTVVNTALTCTLIFLLVSIGLPNINALASTSTSTPTPPLTEQAPQSMCDPARAIQVSGTAVVNVKPDRALIQLGVQSNGRFAKEAQANNTSTINKVVKALKALVIDAKDIARDWYTIEPVYEDYAVQMVYLVLQRYGEEAFGLYLESAGCNARLQLIPITRAGTASHHAQVRWPSDALLGKVKSPLTPPKSRSGKLRTRCNGSGGEKSATRKLEVTNPKVFVEIRLGQVTRCRSFNAQMVS